MFKADAQQDQHSRIYRALNPQQLWYESRRDKEEQEEEKQAVVLRGMAVGDEDDWESLGGMRSQFVAPVQEDDEDDEEEEEDVDPTNLPDFGELQAEMDELRSRRAAAADEHRKKLRQQFEEQRQKELAEMEAELARIAEKEAEIQANLETRVTEDDVRECQQRLEKEMADCFKFTW
eukprot:m.42560 g.42560  ORF g.42560 m.42560 type:complete len:177 (-) comp10708_c0_seq1:2193-2723(-)